MDGASAFYSLEGPLHALPGRGQMRAANLYGFAEFVRNLGGDPFRILERHDIDPRMAVDPEYHISCQSMVNLLEYCSAAFDRSLFGLQLASFQEPDVYGCVTALCRAASTLREALRTKSNYLSVVHSPVTMSEVVEGQETAEMRWHAASDLGANGQANYQGLMLNMKLVRALGGARFKPHYVTLATATRPEDLDAIEAQLGCTVRLGADENAIAFSVHSLDQPIASANRPLFKLLSGYLDCVSSVSRNSIVERVEDYIRANLSSGNCSIERCAKSLQMASRTLQFRLAEQGQKFSEIVQDQQAEMAKTYLARHHMQLDEIAVLLGYSDQTSFGRAFKRRTGMTPQRFRKQRPSIATTPS